MRTKRRVLLLAGWLVACVVGVASAQTTPSATTTPPATTGTTATSAAPTSTTTATPGTTATGQPPTPAAAAEPPTTSPPASASPSATLDGSTYRVRLRDLEQQVDELKEQIRRSHTRLSLLSDTILAGAAGGARAELVFQNDLSGAWQVVEATFVLDGAVQYKKADDSGLLAAQKEIPIFSGSIPAGSHTLQVLLKLRGHGFGVFSYLSGLEATVRHDHSFTVTDGKVFALRAIAWEQGGPTTPVEEQPAIRFAEKVRAMTEPPAAASRTDSTTPAPAQPAGSGATGSGSVGGAATPDAASVGAGASVGSK